MAMPKINGPKGPSAGRQMEQVSFLYVSTDCDLLQGRIYAYRGVVFENIAG
jgi:hypothetical protein